MMGPTVKRVSLLWFVRGSEGGAAIVVVVAVVGIQRLSGLSEMFGFSGGSKCNIFSH